MKPQRFLPILCALTLTGTGGACSADPIDRASRIGWTQTPAQPVVIDLLLVIDDSPSMHDFQATLAGEIVGIGQFFESLGELADVRVMVTTTSVPGPTCSGAFARGGEPLVDPCLAAPPEAFVGPAEFDPEIRDHAEACTSVCSLETIERVISPLDDQGEELALRPWIEAANNSYGGNLAEGVSFAEAISCVAMRGFAGCEFESPIAAASRALDHMRSPGDPAYGFLRDDAQLLILFIGDEDDCSHPATSATIFDPDGERVFWSDPGAGAPTSAVCHNAGTICDDQGCTVANLDLGGAPTDDPAAAVLTPVAELQAKLDILRVERPVHVGLVGGVVGSGEQSMLVYEPGGGQAWLDAFGWGPGCEAAYPGRSAQPPGRLFQLLDPEQPNATSVCTGDFLPVLAPVLEAGKSQIQPNCAPTRIEVAPGELPDCEVGIRTADGELWPIEPCLRDDSGWVIDPETHDHALPPDETRCYAVRSDPADQTPDPADDLTPECVEGGHHAEFAITTRPDTVLPHGAAYEFACVPAD